MKALSVSSQAPEWMQYHTPAIIKTKTAAMITSLLSMVFLVDGSTRSCDSLFDSIASFISDSA
jgi:hypothetical protein